MENTKVISGVSYSGNNDSFQNDKVIIDGKVQTTDDQKQVNIVVNGDIQNAKTVSGDMRISGDATNFATPELR